MHYMGEQDLQSLFDQAEDILIQNIIDQQEGVLGAKESTAFSGRVPAPKDLDRWHDELEELASARKKTAAFGPTRAIRPQKKLLRTIVLVAIILSILIVSSNAFRIHFVNWTSTISEIYMEFRAGRSAKDTVEGWSQVFIPGKVPDGYEISEAASTKSSMYIEYSDSEGHRVTYYQYAASAVVRIDTEAADDKIALGDGQAYLFTKAGISTTISWNKGDYSFSIEYDPNQVDQREIEEMAMGLQWKA